LHQAKEQVNLSFFHCLLIFIFLFSSQIFELQDALEKIVSTKALIESHIHQVVQENEEMHDVLRQQNEKLALFVDQQQYQRRRKEDEKETPSNSLVSFQNTPLLMENVTDDNHCNQNPSQSHVQPTVLPQAERKYRNPNNPSPNSNPNPNSGKLAPAFSPTVSVYDGRRLEGKLQVPSLQVKKQFLSEVNLGIPSPVNGNEMESASTSPVVAVAANSHSHSNDHFQYQLVNGSGSNLPKTFKNGNGKLEIVHQMEKPQQPHLEKSVDWPSNKLKFQALLKIFERTSE
jgi:hypothetical protein